MDIYLIRHGESYKAAGEHYDAEKGTMNPPLTPKGIWQAERLAERCRAIRFDAIFSSDASRAVQTAMAIDRMSPSTHRIDSAFREIDMGDVHTKPWSAFPDVYDQWSRHEEDIPYPNGENGADVWNRCKKRLDRIVEQEYRNVAIVCHGGTIRSILCGILDIPQQKRFR